MMAITTSSSTSVNALGARLVMCVGSRANLALRQLRTIRVMATEGRRSRGWEVRSRGHGTRSERFSQLPTHQHVTTQVSPLQQVAKCEAWLGGLEIKTACNAPLLTADGAISRPRSRS